ncbi:MAG: sugar transferase [Clostridia bacterium]|jgi:lipopolysaccharide/colanic/teichoic acid biosynthesis glycosyltransferase|nr:sugar transferase [Clostridia bacterium]
MKNMDLAIPFDEAMLHENFLKKFLSRMKRIAKSTARRITDIVLSFFGLIFLIPVSLLIKYIYLRDDDHQPIFIFEDCIGKNGKTFRTIKYRSINKDGTHNRLRRTALDNLPKLINVFKGEMTIVGPQPYKVSDKERMGTYYNRIVQMKPGMTGISQISLIYDKSFESRLDNDIRYYYQKGLWTDLKIMLITSIITIPTRNKGEILGYLNLTVKDIGRSALKLLNRFVKRIIDILGAIAGIIALIPLTVVVAIINFISGDGGPLFFSQERIGKNGKQFKMYKFRSMVVGADEKLKELLENDEEARKEFTKYKKLKNDPRVTKVGNILRKTSLDEFPQFINVLKGEMSLVGPRPYLLREKDEMKNYYDIVIQHKPGVTGLWQIEGRSETTFNERLNIDLRYHRKSNVISDVKILCKTFTKVLKNEGAA